MVLRLGYVRIALAFIAVCCSAVGQDAESAEYPIIKQIPAIDTDRVSVPEQALTISEVKGWIVATLRTSADIVEWEIVLAESRPDIVPTVSIHATLPSLSIEYGPYFIRETAGRLRVLRERKDPKDDSWAVLGTSEGKTVCGASVSGHHTFVAADGEWLWLCTAPDEEGVKIDARIRFQHASLSKGYGSMSLAGTLTEVFCGDARCHDEGDLLVANRMRSYRAKEVMNAVATEERLIGSRMPAITGEMIGNDEEPPFQLADVQGKVVLVDFWATWCAPCVKSLPEVESLYQKFRDQGFVVVGVHSRDGSDGVENFLAENPVSFPIVIDDGDTAKNYAVSAFPTYVLIGRKGTVISAFENKPPSTERIEAVLNESK